MGKWERLARGPNAPKRRKRKRPVHVRRRTTVTSWIGLVLGVVFIGGAIYYFHWKSTAVSSPEFQMHQWTASDKQRAKMNETMATMDAVATGAVIFGALLVLGSVVILVRNGLLDAAESRSTHRPERQERERGDGRPPQRAHPQDSDGEVVGRLKTLRTLRDSGELSEGEYEAERRRILDSV